MIDEQVMEKVYRERLDENIISQIAEMKGLDLNKAMDIYYNSKLADRISKGLYGIQYLDYRNLTQLLIDTEPEAFEDTIPQKVLEEIRALAKRNNITQVLLFGSRARGDHHRTSDIDLATKGGDHERFALDVDEETSTLLKIDCVDLDGEVSDELRQSIEREGKIIYEGCSAT